MFPLAERCDSLPLIPMAIDMPLSRTVNELLLRMSHDGKLFQGRHSLFSTSLATHLWEKCELLTECGHTTESRRAFARLQVLVSEEADPFLDKRMDFKAQLQLLCLQEKEGFASEAIRGAKHLANVVARATFPEKNDMLVETLLTASEWGMKHRLIPAHMILRDVLDPCVDVVSTHHLASRSGHQSSNAYLLRSRLLFTLFNALTTRINTYEWKRQTKRLEDREAELEQCKVMLRERRTSTSSTSRGSDSSTRDWRDLLTYIAHLEKEVESSRIERDRILCSRSTFRDRALADIATALSIGGGSDSITSIYRFVSLWFGAVDESSVDEAFCTALRKFIGCIPTFHFVPVFSQLLSRLQPVEAGTTDMSQSSLQDLVVHVCADHPYHCLVQLVALVHGDSVTPAASTRSPDELTKSSVALQIIDRLKGRDNSQLLDLIESYQIMTRAYIHLSLIDTAPYEKSMKAISFAEAGGQVSSLRIDQCLGSGRRRVAKRPCIFTKPPPVRHQLDYVDESGELIGSEFIQGFEPTFRLTAGGIHRPKVVVCEGSRGGSFRQLVKAEDDIRQDAVMQQVFRFLNSIMLRTDRKQHHNDTRCQIVTYSAIPLSKSSGVRATSCQMHCDSLLTH